MYVNRNCGSSYNLNTVGNVELYLTEALNSECQITVEKNKEWDSEFPRLCVSPETFSGCQVTVEVHNIMVINGYHDKVYYKIQLIKIVFKNIHTVHVLRIGISKYRDFT